MNRSKRIPAVACLLATLTAGALVAATAGTRARPAGAADPPPVPPLMHVQVLSTRPHDTSAFTQGLLLYQDELYESTGEFGKSTLRRVDPLTGEVRQRVDLDDLDIFAEGLARVDERLIQLTWKNGLAFEYDLHSFEKLGELTYITEGWGLCYDGESLVMSDGSSTLYFRDPDTFAIRRTLKVTWVDPRAEDLLSEVAEPLSHLNELECVGSEVYANVWLTDDIVRIDKATGRVTAVIDASGLLTPAEDLRADVLNGIAWDAEAQTFLITGKWWPWLFEVRFVTTQFLPLGLDNFPLFKR